MFLNCLLILLLLTILYKTYRFHTYWCRQGVKGPNVWNSLLSYTRVIPFNDMQLQQKYGNIIGFYEIFKRCLIINEPKLIKDILIKDFHIFTNRRYYSFGEVFDLGIVMARDDDWKRIRSVVAPAFTASKLRLMFDTIANIGDQFCNNIEGMAEKGKDFDIKYYINAFVMDVICCCGFGLDIRSIEDPYHPVIINAKKAFDYDLTFAKIVGYIAPTLGKLLKLKGIDANAVDFFRQLVSDIIEKRKSKQRNENNLDFMQLMIDANNDIHKSEQQMESSTKISKSKSLSLDELTATAITFLIGGYDTTSATLSHFCYYIAKYPECQQILFKELTKIDKLDDRSLQECRYLNAVIDETLRLCPPGCRFDREAAEDYLLEDYGIVIPKGCLVTFSGYVVHRNANNFSDPDQFKPERFLSEHMNDEPMVCIPFGLGPRMCVAIRFAINEMRIFVAKLILRYRLELTANTRLSYPTGNLLFIPKEILIGIKKRIE